MVHASHGSNEYLLGTWSPLGTTDRPATGILPHDWLPRQQQPYDSRYSIATLSLLVYFDHFSFLRVHEPFSPSILSHSSSSFATYCIPPAVAVSHSTCTSFLCPFLGFAFPLRFIIYHESSKPDHILFRVSFLLTMKRRAGSYRGVARPVNKKKKKEEEEKAARGNRRARDRFPALSIMDRFHQSMNQTRAGPITPSTSSASSPKMTPEATASSVVSSASESTPRSSPESSPPVSPAGSRFSDGTGSDSFSETTTSPSASTAETHDSSDKSSSDVLDKITVHLSDQSLTDLSDMNSSDLSEKKSLDLSDMNTTDLAESYLIDLSNSTGLSNKRSPDKNSPERLRWDIASPAFGDMTQPPFFDNYLTIPASPDDGESIAEMTVECWKQEDWPTLLWPVGTTMSSVIEPLTARMTKSMYDCNRFRRHEMAIDKHTGQVVGYIRWSLPKNQATAWTERRVPRYEEDRKKIQKASRQAVFQVRDDVSAEPLNGLKLEEKITQLKAKVVQLIERSAGMEGMRVLDLGTEFLQKESVSMSECLNLPAVESKTDVQI